MEDLISEFLLPLVLYDSKVNISEVKSMNLRTSFQLL